MAGRQKESEQFKSAFSAYNSLSETEQQTFRSKEFNLMLAGLYEEDKKDFRNQREALLANIKTKRELQVKIEGLKDIPASVLEAALEAKKKAK